jgi:hypothetical protein
MYHVLPAELLSNNFKFAPRDTRCRPCCSLPSLASICRLLCAQAMSARRVIIGAITCSNTGAAHQFKKQRFSASSRASKLKAQLREDEELSATLANVRRMTLAEAPFTAVVREEEVKLDLGRNLAARNSKHATVACENMQASISGAGHVTGSA